MASNDQQNQQIQAKILEIRQAINKLNREDQALYQNSLDALEASNASLKDYNRLLRNINDELDEVRSSLDYISKSFLDSVNALSRQDIFLKMQKNSLEKLSSLAREGLNIRRGDVFLEEKKFKKLQEEARQQLENLKIVENRGGLEGEALEALLKEIKAAEKLIENFEDISNINKEINKDLGFMPKIAGGLDKALSKIGLPELGFNDAIEETFKLGQETKGLGKDFDAVGTFTSKMGENLKNAFSKANMIQLAITQLVDALIKTDQSTGDLAKNMGISYDESLQMVDSMNNIANVSGETYVTTEKLVKSQIALSKAFGTNAQLSGELLKDYTQITEQAGYSAEAATSLGKITQATGGDLSKNTASILGAATAFNVTNKLALNEKEIVEEVAKTGAATVLTFGKSAKALANNVLEAKKFGLNLEQASKISEGLLNFQSSIESELEAELLTGKQLNFEQARFLALQGKTGEAAAEVAKQVGGSAEFGKMNVIQQEALAKSVGLSRDDLAQSILDREVLAKLGEKEGTAQEAYNKLKAQGLSDDAIAAKLGDEKLASQLKSQSVQERFNASIAKMQDIFVSIAEPILAIVSPLMDLATSVLPIINMILQPILWTFKQIGAAVQGFTSLIKGDLKDGMGGVVQIAQSIATIWAGIVLGAKLLGKETLKNITYQNTLGTLLTKDFWKSIAGAIAKAWGSIVGFLGPFGIPIAIAAGAGLVGLASKFFSKGNDIVSPGYGKRTLMAPEGAIQLNDKDTIIAGTDLGGGKTPSPTSSPSIDLSPLLAKMDQMNAILNQLLTKEGTVTLDGNKVGQALSMGSYKMQ